MIPSHANVQDEESLQTAACSDSDECDSTCMEESCLRLAPQGADIAIGPRGVPIFNGDLDEDVDALEALEVGMDLHFAS
jgi:hypothetical protein